LKLQKSEIFGEKATPSKNRISKNDPDDVSRSPSLSNQAKKKDLSNDEIKMRV